MIVHDRYYFENLRWTTTGEIWASWALNSLPVPRTIEEAAVVAEIHANLMRTFIGYEGLITGHLVETSPVEVVSRLLDGAEHTPALCEEIDALIDNLPGLGLAHRRWSIHIRLNPHTKTLIKSWATSATNRLLDAAGLTPLTPTQDEVDAYLEQAHKLQQAIPEPFQPRPLTEAEMLWQRRHAQTRAEILDPTSDPDDTDLILPGGCATLTEPVLDPHGLTDLQPNQTIERAQAPINRRWLKITNDAGETSYQSGLILATIPKNMNWYEAQVLGNIDQANVPLDIAIWFIARPRALAATKIRHAWRHLNDQIDQVEQTDPTQASQTIRLHDAATVLADYQTHIQRDEKECEIAPVIMVSTASLNTGTEADQYATEFINAPHQTRFTWARPIGSQITLWQATQPGNRPNRQLRDYQQITTSTAFGTSAPILSHHVGDQRGFALAVNHSTPLHSLVLLDLFGNVDQNKSASIAILGDQGAGKSFTQKLICGSTIDRGGRMIATDITPEREWTRFANSLDVPTATVDLTDPEHSLDPIRLFGPNIAGPIIQTFLTTLLNVPATGPEGITIAKAVKPAYLAHHNITSMGDLYQHLTSNQCTLNHHNDIADRIGVFADPDLSSSLASAIFDPRLTAMDMNARAIVINTASVSQPTADELLHAHRFNSLGPEKLFGRAIYALIATIAKTVSFADRRDNCLFNIDEFHHYQSPEALAAVSDIVRIGRHVRSGLCIGTHDQLDLGDDQLQGLIRNRLVMRSDANNADRNAAFLGYRRDKDPDRYDAVVDMITSLPSNTSGYGVYRDSNNGIATIRVLAPARKSRLAAVDTRPPKKEPAS